MANYEFDKHYENITIQIYWKKRLPLKNGIFPIKKSDIFFHISAQNMDYEYLLERPSARRFKQISTIYFWAEIKIMCTHVNHSFTI